MEDISDVHFTEYIPTIYTTPARVNYLQNGKQRTAEVFMERNGVAIILYNKTKDVLILVRQFRPSVYHQLIPENEHNNPINISKYHPSQAVTLEFCAGLEDKDLPSEQVAQEEILEECGYKVSLESLEKVCTFPNLSETTGSRMIYFYCEVTEEQRVNAGGGNEEEDEMVEVVEMKVADVVEYAGQDYVCSPISFMFALNWFLYHKYRK